MVAKDGAESLTARIAKCAKEGGKSLTAKHAEIAKGGAGKLYREGRKNESKFNPKDGREDNAKQGNGYGSALMDWKLKIGNVRFQGNRRSMRNGSNWP